MTHGILYFLHTPEAATSQLYIRRAHKSIVGGSVDIDQFALTTAVEDVLIYKLRLETGDAKFFADFAVQGLLWCLAKVYMATYSGVPLAWLDVFPLRALLQIELATRVEDMQVDDGVEQARATMALATSGRAYDTTRLVNDWEYLLVIVVHHDSRFSFFIFHFKESSPRIAAWLECH